MTLAPEAIYQQSVDKQRIVITGSGKSLITRMVVHILKSCGRKFDYVVDNQINKGQEYSPIIIIETGEPLLGFKHHIGILSSIADKSAQDRFKAFADATPKGGTLLYTETDSIAKSIGSAERPDVQSIPYKAYKHEIKNGITSLISSKDERFPLKVAGAEYLEAIAAAKEVLKKIGISSNQFYKAIAEFE